MVEISSFPNGSGLLTMDDNHSEPQIDTTPHSGFIPERGVFITKRGEEIELTGKPVNKLMLERLVNEGKPKIPMIEVVLLGKHRQLQANASDPNYLALMEEWNAEQKIKVLRYLLLLGVKGQPTQAFLDEQRMITPDANEGDMKYFWITGKLDDEEIDSITDVIMGSFTTTAKGVQEAANFSTSK